MNTKKDYLLFCETPDPTKLQVWRAFCFNDAIFSVVTQNLFWYVRAESEKAEIEEELSKIQEERSKCEDVIREKLSKSATILEQSQQEAQKVR